MESGKKYEIKFVIDEKGLDNALGLDCVILELGRDGVDQIYDVQSLEVVAREGDLFTFQGKLTISNAGSFKVAYRLYPKHPDLPHKQDFNYVKWIQSAINS